MLYNYQGGDDTKCRQVAALMLRDKGTLGVSLGGFLEEGCIGKLKSVVDALTSHDALICLPCVGTPQEILVGLWCGVDLFHPTYPFLLAEVATIFNFVFPVVDDLEDGHQPDDLLETLLALEFPNALHLGLRKYADDNTSLPGHYQSANWPSRAYVHHLVNSGEMLGDTLVANHNVRQYFDLFAHAREAKRRNKLHSWIRAFSQSNFGAGDLQQFPKVKIDKYTVPITVSK